MTDEEFNKDDGLTDEERAALAEDDGQDPDAPAREGVEDDEDEGGEDDGESAGRDDGADPEPDEEVEADVEREARPILNAQLPDDYESKMAAIQTGKDELIEQFDNGDITAKELQTKLDELNRSERELEAMRIKVEIANEMREQQRQQQWQDEIAAFVKVTHNGIYTRSELAWDALDKAVRITASDPANQKLSGPELLALAHKRVAAELGWEEQKPKAEAKAEPEAKKPAKPKVEIPPTLAKMPAAEMSDTSGNRFAALDRLMERDPIAYEEAVGKLSKADMDAYLGSR